MDLHGDHDRLVHAFDEMTNRAVGVDADDRLAWFERALALSWQWRCQAALEANAKASNLDPNHPYPLVQRAMILLYSGGPPSRWRGSKRHSRWTPQFTRKVLAQRCKTYLALGRYDEAIANCEISVADSDYWLKHS